MNNKDIFAHLHSPITVWLFVKCPKVIFHSQDTSAVYTKLSKLIRPQTAIIQRHFVIVICTEHVGLLPRG